MNECFCVNWEEGRGGPLPLVCRVVESAADKDIRGMLIKLADDMESLGRADVLSDGISTPHLHHHSTLQEPGGDGG
jgi:hypothetical protein